MSQLNLFTEPDQASRLASACLGLAWEIVQLRSQLEERGAAELWGELALVQEAVARIRTRPAAVIPITRAACRRA